jgi:hypothetical protein
MWIFTRHALRRLRERGYAPADVLAVVDGGVPALVFPSPREKSVDIYFGRVGEKYIMVPADRTKRTIITVRPMRKKEKEIFRKEMENG